MTTIELREELFREMNPLLDSETAMKKIIAYVKELVVAQNKKSGAAAPKGWAAAAKKAHAAGEDKQVTVDDFAGAWATMDDDMLDAALAKFHKDWGGEGTAREIADELRSSRENSRTVETW